MHRSILLSLAASAAAAPLAKRSGTVYGFDVSDYQPNVNMQAAYNSGLRFVFIKATQGTDYISPSFNSQYTDATNAGFIRGGYHYADGTGDGSQEADYFLAHGGGWSDDGITLPGMLDLEADCKSVSWIQTFSDTYHSRTGVYPILYSSPSWWEQCTGNSDAFVNTNPLFMACYNSEPCTPQGDWPYYTFWQYNDDNANGGDSDQFNGDYAQLQAIARG
ncbi:glycoside hydrolase family 25 protein [Neohortaea acidophila]|uniref:N,O-diacetylmuramidase n=1 Tax=Neohortaea acidophila TaxID=245834 RepID=A0A6A6PR00_9PEZI|nr:glycoside hydrolase family 25 protein [Neohortaea acidophila]KAF2482548.1 glycoside hydrolase family 25 protein [Neohortaea acidophila]